MVFGQALSGFVSSTHRRTRCQRSLCISGFTGRPVPVSMNNHSSRPAAPGSSTAGDVLVLISCGLGLDPDLVRHFLAGRATQNGRQGSPRPVRTTSPGIERCPVRGMQAQAPGLAGSSRLEKAGFGPPEGLEGVPKAHYQRRMISLSLVASGRQRNVSPGPRAAEFLGVDCPVAG